MLRVLRQTPKLTPTPLLRTGIRSNFAASTKCVNFGANGRVGGGWSASGLTAVRRTSLAPRFFSTSTDAPAAKESTVKFEEEGDFGTTEYRMYALGEGGKRVSYWHDLPLQVSASTPASPFPLYNFVLEMPKGTQDKMEISTSLDLSPIIHDTKKGKIRVITYGKSRYNYGALPQTWEDPTKEDKKTGLLGDDDPVDVVELSGFEVKRGSVRPVRVLGALALVDEGETDWKVLAVDADHPAASQLPANPDQAQIDTFFPGAVAEIRDWYRMYKTADGKPENDYSLGGELVGEEEAVEVVQECHEAWRARQQ